jgi:hypothetical protein
MNLLAFGLLSATCYLVLIGAAAYSVGAMLGDDA